MRFQAVDPAKVRQIGLMNTGNSRHLHFLELPQFGRRFDVRGRYHVLRSKLYCSQVSRSSEELCIKRRADVRALGPAPREAKFIV